MNPVIGFARGLTEHPAYIQDLSFPYAWLEAPLDARLARLTDVPDWHDIAIWPSGRLFGKTGEYRWQRLPYGTLHAVLLLEADPLPEPFSAPLELAFVRDAAFILWGEWAGDPQGSPGAGPCFYANEIPHIQTYPIDLQGQPQGNETPRVIVRYYSDSSGEQGGFVRCVDFALKAEAEEQ